MRPSHIEPVRQNIETLIREQVVGRVEATFGTDAAEVLNGQISACAMALTESLFSGDARVSAHTARILNELFPSDTASGHQGPWLRTPLGAAIMSTWDPMTPLAVDMIEKALGISRGRVYQLLDNKKLEEASTTDNRRRATARSVVARMRMQHAQNALFAAIGHIVDLDSTPHLKVVLYDELGLPPVDETYPTDTDSLVELHRRTGHPVLAHLLDYRGVTADGRK